MKYSQMLLLVFLCFCSSLYAQQIFDEIDGDGDGYISQSEANVRADITQNWSKADLDKDGRLDVSEFSAFEGREMFVPAEVEEPEPGAAPTR